MLWHAQVITIVVRGYPAEAGLTAQTCFDAKEPYTAVATVQLLDNGQAHVQGMKGGGTVPMTRRDYQDLLRMLSEDFGTLKLDASRHGKDTSYDTSPAPLD